MGGTDRSIPWSDTYTISVLSVISALLSPFRLRQYAAEFLTGFSIQDALILLVDVSVVGVGLW
jgi:hypothetical protein